MSVLVTLLVCSTLYLLYRSLWKAKRGPYPPSPQGLPVVGHTLQVPIERTWKYFEKMYHELGPIYKLSLAGDSILILSDPADAEELLGKRSQIYSSRKQLIYAGKYQSNDKRFVMLPYGPTLRKHRAVFAQMLQPKSVGAYETSQAQASFSLLHSLLTKPNNWSTHCKRFSASLIFSLSYGRPLSDIEFDDICDILDRLLQEVTPGAHLVDTLPFLDWFPDWFPGMGWRKRAIESHEREMKLYSRLALEVKERLDSGKEPDLECLTARLWDKQKESNLDLEEVSYIAGISFEAGTDTTSTTLQWFFLAMILYPSVQKRAREEILSTLGDTSTLPTFEAFSSLPYCAAVCKEVFRWAPCVPGGFPHLLDADDEYKGYKIDKGTMIIPCLWNLHHNESVYNDSYTFNPDRFMTTNQKQDDLDMNMITLTEGHYGFGFGRRKCPGQYLATKSVWLCIVRILVAFELSPALDENGKEVLPDPGDCTSGVTSSPIEFPLRITVRSKAVEESINAGYHGS